MNLIPSHVGTRGIFVLVQLTLSLTCGSTDCLMNISLRAGNSNGCCPVSESESRNVNMIRCCFLPLHTKNNSRE